MTSTNLYEVLIENDLNPFMLFDGNGKLKDFNKEAEFLFNYVSYRELFELALSYASQSYGINKKYIPLIYGKSKYYALLVGYINDDEIALRLFKEVIAQEQDRSLNQNLELVNIYGLIELAKSTVLIQSDIEIDEMYDISIPEIKLNINNFVITLTECFNLYINDEKLVLKVYIKTGEYEIINDIKYKILCIEFSSPNTLLKLPKSLQESAIKADIDPFIQNESLKLEFTMFV
jgi:hypothetical protein